MKTLLVMSLVLVTWAASARADVRAMPRAEPALEAPQPAIFSRTGFEQKLGATLPQDLMFRDEEGRMVRLGDFLHGRPVVLSLVYFQCPMLCNLVLNGMVDTLREMKLTPGRDFEILTISFNPEETHVLAGQKKANYLKDLNRPGTEEAWHFLVGEDAAIRQLAATVGFRYEWDAKANEYAHGSGIMVITPDGRLSHYFYGVEFPERDLRLALVEASNGRIGRPIDKLQLFCYQYNHALGRYSTRIMALVQVGCLLTILCVGWFVVAMLRREAAARRVAEARA